MPRVSWICKAKTPRDYTDQEIREMIKRYDGNLSETAWMNGFSVSALRRRLKKMGDKHVRTP